jgi:hypothetical protein
MNSYFIENGWIWDGIYGAADRIMPLTSGGRYRPTNPTRRHTEAALAGIIVLRYESNRVWVRNLQGQPRERSVKLDSFVHDYFLIESQVAA